MRVIIAGGGTGGHIIPALAIARELQASHSAEMLFIGTPRGMEGRLVPASGFELKMVKVGALKGVSMTTRLNTLFDLPRAVMASRAIIRDFRADMVIGVGGYASGPAMLAAILGGIPTLAFESNFVPGFANRVVARFVSVAAVHFKETAKYFRNARVTGVPVRKDFFGLPERDSMQPPTLLVTGGSQGAQALNYAVCAALPALSQQLPGIQITHQTGEKDYQKVKTAYEATSISAKVSPFIADMPSAFAAADLLLCRSGASTVAEVATAGKVAVFVPFPYATDDHQRRNAEALSSKGAALLIPEKELTGKKLAEVVVSLLQDRKRLQEMAQVSRSLSHPDAAGEIARMAVALMKDKN